MKKYKAVEHADHFEIHYAGDKKPFKVAKGVLTKERLNEIRRHADEIKYADGDIVEAAKQKSLKEGGKLQQVKDPKTGIIHLVGRRPLEEMHNPNIVPEGYFNRAQWRNAMDEIIDTDDPEERKRREKILEKQKEAIEKRKYEKTKKVPSTDSMSGRTPSGAGSFAEGGMVMDQESEEPMLKEEYGDEIPHMTMFDSGGYVVTRSSDRKGKTHKVTNKATGEVRYFGDSNLGQHPKDKGRRASFYARHRKNLAKNPFFRAFARATWKADGGEIQNFAEGEDEVTPTVDYEDMPVPQGVSPVRRPVLKEIVSSSSSPLTITGGEEPSGYREDPLTTTSVAPEVSDMDLVEAQKRDEEAAKAFETTGTGLGQEDAFGVTEAVPESIAIRRRQAEAAPKIRAYVFDSLADTDLTEEQRRALAEEAATQKDPNAYAEIVSTAFKDALNEGATLDEARKIVRQMRRRGEDIGIPPDEGVEAVKAREEGVVDLQGLEAPEEGKPLSQLASEAMEKKGAAPAPAIGAHQPAVKEPAAAGEPTVPAKPLPGEVAVPESELMQMPEYGIAYEAMNKALGGKNVKLAQDYAKEYALKSRQAQVFDTSTPDGLAPEAAFQQYVEEQVKEANFQNELNRRAFAASEALRKKDEELSERKAASTEMRMRILQDRSARLRDEIANFKEDPKRFFSSQSAGDKTVYQILTLIAGLGGQGDNFVNNMVARDLALQRADLQKKETLLGKYVQEGNDLKDAYTLAKTAQKEVYATKLEGIANQIKDPLMASQARATVAKLRAQNVDDFLTIAKKAVDLDYRDDEIQNRIAHRSAQDMIGLMNATYRINKEGRLAKVDPYAKARLDLAIERENRMRRKEMRDLAAAGGSEDQQRLLNGEQITGAQLRNVDKKVVDDYAVPVLDPTTGRPTGYYTAAHSPDGKKKVTDFEVAKKDYIGTLDQLEGMLAPSIGIGGLAGYSETASPAEYRTATILQRDLITKLGALSALGVLQKSDVDFLMTIVPNLTSYERADGKRAAFQTFRQTLGRMLQNRKDAYLVTGDTAAPPAPAARTPFSPQPVPQIAPLQLGGGGVRPAAPAPAPSGGVRPSAPAKPPQFKRSKSP